MRVLVTFTDWCGLCTAVLVMSSMSHLSFASVPDSLKQNGQHGRQPNIVVILADDLGYGDLGGKYGGVANTPHLNRMATEGMMFTDFHSNGPMCSPTRASLLTGRYPQRLGIERALPTDWEDQGIGSDRNKSELTIAEYLRQQGYVTGIYGKWHLGKHSSANPVHHGFDDFRGLTCGCGDYFTKMDRHGFRDWWHNDKLDYQEGYATDVITDNSLDFIKQNKGKPFFLYVAYNAIHFPWQTAEDYELETRLEGGDYTSNYPGPASKLGPHSKDEIPGVVLDMIETLDRGVGKILETLKQQGIDRETLVIFSSDNGGYLRYAQQHWPWVSSNGPLRGQKGEVYEGGHRVPAIVRWPGRIPAGTTSEVTAMTFDLLPTVLDLLEISLPPEDSRNTIDGKSLLPVLLQKKSLEARPLFWRIGDQKAVRHGEWKLVIPDKGVAPELYNLNVDLGETTNLALRYAAKVDELTSILLAWEKAVDDDR